MTIHAAPVGATAVDPFETMRDVLDEASSAATEGREWLDPIPAEQIEFLGQDQPRGRWIIAPILDPSSVRIEKVEYTFEVTDDGLDRLRNGDAAFASAHSFGIPPVHSVGSVTVLHTRHWESWEAPGDFDVVYTVEAFSAPTQEAATYEEARTIAKNLAARTPSAPAVIRAALRDGNLAGIRATTHTVNVELAVAHYDDDAPIINYIVVEGSIDLRA